MAQPESVARQLASFVTRAGPASLPSDALKHAAMLVASTLASASAGTKISSAGIIGRLARERGGAEQATLWFDGGARLPMTDAARANVALSEAAASDDSDLRTIMHCGAPLVAAALAAAERERSDGESVLAAIVLGYEVAGRLHDAIPDFRRSGFHGSALTIFAATVAAGRLIGLDPAQMTHAIALGATSAAGLTAAAVASTAREYNGAQAVANGMEAARAAAAGFTAEERILEMPGGFFESVGRRDGREAGHDALRDLDGSWDILTDLAIKLMPGGHPFHAVAEAAANAAREGNVVPAAVARIVVSRVGTAKLPTPLHPVDLVGMAHSAAFFAAAAVADGELGWEHAGQAKIGDPNIHRLIDRVEAGPAIEDDVGAFRQGARVTIETEDGRSVTSTVLMPRGAAASGLDWAVIDGKFRALMPRSGLADHQIGAALDLIHGLHAAGGVSPLLRAIIP